MGYFNFALILALLPFGKFAHAEILYINHDLSPTDNGSDDYFGISVASVEGTIVIGACWNVSESGSAYIFSWSGTGWEQQAKLTADDGAPMDSFGKSVAAFEDKVIVGAPGNTGAAYVFNRIGAQWVQQAKLIAPDGTVNVGFGNSVAISHDFAVVGADGQNDNYTGSVFVFKWAGSFWEFNTKLMANDGAANSKFGFSVDVTKNRIVVGAPLDSSSRGAVYSYTWDDTEWSEQATRKTGRRVPSLDIL